MGAILERKGNLEGAMRVYDLALSRLGSTSTTPVAVKLHARVEGLKKKGVTVQELKPDRTLQEQRTFHVPRPKDVRGSGVFVLQVSSAKTEKVAMVSGDEELRVLRDALVHLDLGLEIPKASHALLLRSGVLVCSTEPTCELVLTPPESANVK